MHCHCIAIYLKRLYSIPFLLISAFDVFEMKPMDKILMTFWQWISFWVQIKPDTFPFLLQHSLYLAHMSWLIPVHIQNQMEVFAQDLDKYNICLHHSTALFVDFRPIEINCQHCSLCSKKDQSNAFCFEPILTDILLQSRHKLLPTYDRHVNVMMCRFYIIFWYCKGFAHLWTPYDDP